MSSETERIIELLSGDEPNYKEAQRYGESALVHIETMVERDDAELSSRALSLLGMIGSSNSLQIIEKALRSKHIPIRLAASNAVAKIPLHNKEELISRFLDDPDSGVRMSALRAIDINRLGNLRSKIEAIRNNDPNAGNRFLAEKVVRGRISDDH